MNKNANCLRCNSIVEAEYYHGDWYLKSDSDGDLHVNRKSVPKIHIGNGRDRYGYYWRNQTAKDDILYEHQLPFWNGESLHNKVFCQDCIQNLSKNNIIFHTLQTCIICHNNAPKYNIHNDGFYINNIYFEYDYIIEVDEFDNEMYYFFWKNIHQYRYYYLNSICKTCFDTFKLNGTISKQSPYLNANIHCFDRCENYALLRYGNSMIRFSIQNTEYTAVIKTIGFRKLVNAQLKSISNYKLI